MNKKFVIISLSVALLIVATITISSYAYFTISNKEGEENVITSGTMSLLFTDGNQITANSLLPGQYIEKEFSVKNNGNVDTEYDVYLSEVINNFADRTDLVYELISTDGGYNTTSQTQVPNTSRKIVSAQPIIVNDTHHYKLKITFLNKNENQDDNQGKIFNATIQINEYKDIDTTINYYLDNEIVSVMPINDGTNEYKGYTCTQNAEISFDTTNWEYELINVTQNNTVCNLYFESNKLSAINVTTNPTKMNYSDTTETLDLSGMVVTASYEDGTSKVLSFDDITISPANGSTLTVGNNTVIISYTENGVTKTTSINVTAESMHIAQSSLNTIGYNAYNGNITNFEYTSRLRPSTSNPDHMRNIPYIMIPENMDGKKINIKYTLYLTYSSFQVAFMDSSYNLIGNLHVYLNPTAANYDNCSLGNYCNGYPGYVEAIQNNDILTTGTLTIPSNTRYVGVYMHNTNDGAKIYDMYITD